MHLTALTAHVRVRPILCLRALLAGLMLTAMLAGPVSAAPANDDDVATGAFLGRLLDEINKRREQAGTQRLAYIAPGATGALDDFFAQTLPELAWPGPCVHHLVDGEDSGEYVLARGFVGEVRGEVLACPGPEEPYWTPNRTADEWWSSPGHFEVLYGDPDANSLACSVVGVQGGPPASGGKGKGKNRGPSRPADAASAVLCVTFHDGDTSSDTQAQSAAALAADVATVWEAEADDERAVEPEAADEAVESEPEPGDDLATESASEAAADEAIEPAAEVQDESDAEAAAEVQDESDGEPAAADSVNVAVFDPDKPWIPTISPKRLLGIPQMGQDIALFPPFIPVRPDGSSETAERMPIAETWPVS
jgi:hypothetical protein